MHYSRIERNNFPILTEKQEAIIIGSLLGDGEITQVYSTTFNNSFVKTQCKKYKEYIEWHFQELHPYVSDIKKRKSRKKAKNLKSKIIHETVHKRLIGYYIRTLSHPIFTELRKTWYPKNKKIIPKNIKLSPLAIAIWFCDDGTNCIINRKASISTNGFAFKDVKFLVKKLKKFNLTPKIRKEKSYTTNKYHPRLFFTGKDYDNLINLIKNYIVWDCFKYKILWRKALLNKEQKGGIQRKLNYEKIKQAIDLRNKGASWQKLSVLFNVAPISIRKACQGINYSNFDLPFIKR